MNIEARDPIFRGLDELARLTDDLVVDRMPGITRKARTNRRRRVGAGVAALAVVVAGAVGAAQVLTEGTRRRDRGSPRTRRRRPAGSRSTSP